MKLRFAVPRWRNYVPIVDAIARYRRRDLSQDIVAGVLVGVITVPQAIAYAFLAGLPPEAGLYASLVPPLIYAIFGSSHALSVGPVAVVAIMVAEAARGHAVPFTHDYVAVAATISLQAGIALWLLRMSKMGRVINLLSHPVIDGFINAAAIMIIVSQLPALIGIPGIEGGPFPQVEHLLDNIGAFNPVALTIGIASMAVLSIVRRYGFYAARPFLRRVGRNHAVTRTGPLVVAALSIAVVALWHLDQRYGIATVGFVPAGLPGLSWPSFDLTLLLDVMPASVMIALVAYVQSVSIATQLAERRRQRFSTNQELIALGAADIGAAFTGGMPVAGSMSRSTGGAATRFTGVFGVLFVAVILLWGTSLFGALPHPALAAIIIVSVADFIDFKPIFRYWKFDRHDSITHIVALLGVLAFGVERGLLIGLLIAVALFIRRSSQPHIAIVGRLGDSVHFRSEKRHEVVTHPSVIAVRIDESLYFANASLVEERLLRLVTRNANVRHLLLVCSAINFIDTSGLKMLERLDRALLRRGVDVHLSDVKGPVMDQLSAARFEHRMSGRIFFTADQAMRTLLQPN